MTRFIKFLVRLLLLVMVLANAFIIMHAYRFTRFTEEPSKLTRSSVTLSSNEKIATLLWGVRLPKPKVHKYPVYAYKHVQVASNAVLDAWFTQVKKAKGTVVLCHGFGGEKSSLNNVAAQFQRMGYNTFQFDFMGAGSSSDNRCTIGYLEAQNVKDVVAYLEGKGFTNIIGFGASMGAVALLRAAGPMQVPFSALVLECPFGSMLQTVAARFDLVGVPPFPLANLLTFWGGAINGFNAFSHNAMQYASTIKVPTLLLHGAKDEYVTTDEVSAIYSQLNGPKKLHVFKSAQHENYNNRFADQWVVQVTSFLKKN